MMNREVKKRWVAALRSGEYEQTAGKLRDEVGFCCLGVLYDIEADDWWENVGGPCWLTHKDGMGARLPEWLSDQVGISIDDQSYLAGMNDNGKTFKQIAAYIERYL